MKIVADAEAGSVNVAAPRAVYSDDAVLIAGRVFAGRAEVYRGSSRTEHELTLVPRRRGADAAALEALGGEFLNELLNQEYRFAVARFNRRIADLIATQTLLSARGGETPPAPPPDSPELEAQARRLMEEARDELRRTSPRGGR